MAESRRKTEEAIFYMALEKSPEERQACLKDACGGDTNLLGRVEALLKAREIEDDFLRAPVLDPDMTLDNSTPAEGPGGVIGNYKLLERLGEGGMAGVYMAEQERPVRRKVALKIIKLGMDTKEVIARFEAERQALAMMDHPSIAKVFDAGATDAGRPYFVMELVRGISITEYCDKHKLGTSKRLELFVQVCSAVQHAHQKGIIHRDIKPSNVMVRLHDGRPAPKVIDFGIAKATNQRLTEKTLLTRHSQMIGTPAYMSPEQAEMSGLDVDTRTDIYSLGVLLYELLTGATPFDGERLHSAGYLELQRIIREEDPTRPSTKLSSLSDQVADIAKHRNTEPDVLAKTIRGDLDWIVMKSLEKDRTRRYETAHALAEDVQRHLRNEPILARRPSIIYRLHKFCRRNRYRLAVASVILVLAAGILVSLATHAANLKAKWARREALPVITKLVEEKDYLAAFLLASQAEKYIPDDPILAELWPQMSRAVSIKTEPVGADVYYREYSAMDGQWLHLGRSPLEVDRFPRGVYRWKLAKDGYEARECTAGFGAIIIRLQANSNYPEMVFAKSKQCGDYLMDKYEVTNEQFKVFVDEGGYAKQEYWKHPFVKGVEELSWEEGMRAFRDKTARPGPSEWEGGRYPEGRDKYPVSGVSWYEAAAYAEFAGKSLPTISHWSGAAMVRQAGIIVPYSNFGEGPAPVGSHPGIGYNGLYDIAGNVREWG
ncbi:MAG: protein kinase domain-containing protein, partial [Planctomycetota bacterium]